MKKILSILIPIILAFTACKQEATIASKANREHFLNLEILPGPAGPGSEEPHLFVGADGNMYMSWIVKDSSGSASLQYAVSDQDRWSEPEEIASGDDWFVNWADFPAMAVDKQGNKIATYLPKSSAGTYSYDVGYKVLPAHATSWSAEKLLNDDGFKGEHGFVSMIPRPDSGFFVCWLDGRKGVNDGPMSLRGAFLNPQGDNLREDELDLRVCDCCQTSAAWTEKGPVVLFRDRSSEEVRDISSVRLDYGIWRRTIPIFADNWQINGCPVNGPKADAYENNLAVAWFTMPNDTPEVKLIFSPDGGKSFDEPILISQHTPLGRVDVEMLDDMTALVSWLDETEAGASIQIAKVHREKGILAQRKIIDTNAGRRSGFPQMCVYENAIYIAWTDISQGSQIAFSKLAFQ